MNDHGMSPSISNAYVHVDIATIVRIRAAEAFGLNSFTAIPVLKYRVRLALLLLSTYHTRTYHTLGI